MATWGQPWGSCNFWGVLTGPQYKMVCELVEQRVLVQMDDTEGNVPSTRKFRDLMCIFAEGFGHFADVADDVAEGFNLETAIGVQLDMIGSKIGLARSGLDDAFYRTALQVQALILQGQTTGDWTGTVNQILTMVRTFIGPGVQPIVYTLVIPYNFTLDIPGALTTAQIQVLFRLICRALYASVLGFIVIVVPGDNLWDSDAGGATNSGIWCSAHGPTVGTCAVWSYVLTTDVCF